MRVSIDQIRSKLCWAIFALISIQQFAPFIGTNIPGFVTSIRTSSEKLTLESLLNNESVYPTKCDSPIYCDGFLPHTVLLYGYPENSKIFVNQKMLHDEKTILKNFDEYVAGKSTTEIREKNELRKFVEQNFEPIDLDTCDLSDYKDESPIFHKIKDVQYKRFVTDVHELWKTLAAKVKIEVDENSELYSYIYVPHCFIKNENNSFTSMHTWDQYWITQGLIRSDMLKTVEGILLNMYYIIPNYGHMLTDNRIYHIGGAQPPLLIMMTKNYQTAFERGYMFVREHLWILTQEFEYWYKNRTVMVKKNGRDFKMARYIHDDATPRPDSYSFDYTIATDNVNVEKIAEFYVAVRSTVDSGYEFSSRFIKPRRRIMDVEDYSTSIKNLYTQHIIPVDLNCFLQRSAEILSEWYATFGNKKLASKYEKISNDLIDAIHNVLRVESQGMWFDYNTITERNNEKFVVSNFTPLFTNSYDANLRDNYGKQAVDYLIREKIIDGQTLIPYYYCPPVTKAKTLGKWDFPNCLTPTTSILIQGLEKTENENALKVARHFASLWIKTTFRAYENTGHLFEIYNATKLGETSQYATSKRHAGNGGTNGLILTLMDKYGEVLSINDFEDFAEPPHTPLQ